MRSVSFPQAAPPLLGLHLREALSGLEPALRPLGERLVSSVAKSLPVGINLPWVVWLLGVLY